MSSPVIEVTLHDKLNIEPQLDLSGFQSLVYGRKANDVGELAIVLPLRRFRPQLFTQDSVIVVKENGNLANDTIWLVKHIEVSNDWLTVTCEDALAFLKRRYILFGVGTAQAEKFQALDDMLKQIARENVTNATDINRNFAGITTAANTGRAQADRMAFAWKNVLSTMQEIAQNSKRLTYYLTYDIVMSTPKTGVFTTWTGVRGVDRRTGQQQRTFTLNNFAPGATLTIDYEGRATKITALGAGQNEVRRNATVTDPAPLYDTRWGVAEEIIEDGNQTDTTVLQSLARAELGRRTAKITFTGTLIEAGGVRYGRDFGYGDILPVDAFGYQFACRVVTVQTTVSQTELSRTCLLEAV